MTSLRWGSATDIGMVRETNQDSCIAAEPLFAVADGMGGHQGGEVASATALEVLQSSFNKHTKEELLEAVRRANAKVWDKGQLDENLHNMGTTLVALAVIHDAEAEQEMLAIVNVGDSRGYLFRDGYLHQITSDHSLVEEMVRAGEISAEEAETHPRRNIVTRALGVEPTVEVDLDELQPQAGDRILLCSDGLTRELGDDQIAGVLLRLRNPDEATRELITQAKNHGGNDNITVVIVDIEGDSDNQPTDATTSKRKSFKPRLPAASAKPRGGRLTVRMIGFFLAVIALLGVAAGSVVWYARASFYVGLDGEQIVIYRGRPDPVLWFEKTLAERTNKSTSDVLPSALPQLQAGATQSSIDDAHNYIRNLVSEAAAARQTAQPDGNLPSNLEPQYVDPSVPLVPESGSIPPGSTTP